MQESLESKVKRIGPAARSPRSDEAFPYKPRPGLEDLDCPAIRRELNDFFSANMPLIRRVVQTRVGFLSMHDRNDLVAEISLYLITSSIPQYEPARGSKLTTFVWRCSHNRLTELVRQLTRLASQRTRVTDCDKFAARDTSCDRQVERLAGCILSEPERYFRKGQLALLKDLNAYPDSRVKERARRLGFKQDSSCTMLMIRTRAKVAELAEELA